LLTAQLRAAAAVAIAGILAGCSGGGGSSPLAGTMNPQSASRGINSAPAFNTFSLEDSSDVVCTSKKAPSKATKSLPAGGGTVTIPAYLNFTGGATVPSSAPSGTKVTILTSTNNFDSQPIPTGQKGVFFTSLVLNQSVQFSGPNLKSTLKSACLTNGKIYTINVYALGGPIMNPVTAKATGNEIKYTISLANTGNGFPGGVTADIVTSH
jgi:hypothetical protein